VTPEWVLWLWLGMSLVGMVWALRLLHEARRDLAAARRSVREGLHPERIIPLGQQYRTIKTLFVLAALAKVLAGISALMRPIFPEAPAFAVPCLMVDNALFTWAMSRIGHMRKTGLAAIAADLADARQLEKITETVEDNHAILHRLEDAERGPG
jgi:hypothetical protein